MDNVAKLISSLSVSLLATALTGCGAGSYPAQPVNSVSSTTTVVVGADGTTPSIVTFANVPQNTALAVTTHQGFEAFTIANGASALPTMTLQANPTAAWLVTGSSATSVATTRGPGFNLTLPDGKTVSYLTGAGVAGSIGITAVNQTAREWSLPDQSNTVQVDTKLTRGLASTLTYSTYGIWTESTLPNANSANPNGVLNAVGVIAVGVPTVASQMPTTGTGVYSGFASGFVSTATVAAEMQGAVSLTANFATNAIAGSITGGTTKAIGAAAFSGALNDITLAGTISGVGFTGSAAAAAAVAGTTVNISGATGTFGGKFYGPSAAEVAGSVALTGGGANLIAAFGAKK